jgi:chemotaxis protein methyltransferase CheR
MAHSLLADGGRPIRELSHVGAEDIDTLSRACGLPLRAYRPDHVAERVARALDREDVPTVAALATLLRRSPEARSRFRRAVAISVTGRLRDPEQFDLLRERILPDVTTATDLRVWSAGCATGAELLDVADLIDAAGVAAGRLLGSDLLEENIAAARAAAPARFRWEVRDLTAEGAPEGCFDLILCRNVAIYLAPEARTRLVDKLAAALAPGGVLLLGRSERLSAPERHGLAAYADHAYRRPR